MKSCMITQSKDLSDVNSNTSFLIYVEFSRACNFRIYILYLYYTYIMFFYIEAACYYYWREKQTKTPFLYQRPETHLLNLMFRKKNDIYLLDTRPLNTRQHDEITL